MSFHGGIIGVILAIIYSKNIKNTNYNFLRPDFNSFSNWTFFGRIANFINGELFGESNQSPFRDDISKWWQTP